MDRLKQLRNEISIFEESELARAMEFREAVKQYHERQQQYREELEQAIVDEDMPACRSAYQRLQSLREPVREKGDKQAQRLRVKEYNERLEQL